LSYKFVRRFSGKDVSDELTEITGLFFIAHGQPIGRALSRHWQSSTFGPDLSFSDQTSMTAIAISTRFLTAVAGVRRGAGQRKTLERLCSYITRPALANDRVQMNASGQVELI
jgi:hypothetical protein